MNFLEYNVRHGEGALQETLVFSFFHLHPRDCAIPGWTRDGWVARIDDCHAVLAEQTAKGRTLKCEMQTTSALKRGVMDLLKLDDYQ
jgi:hypothetical protein